MNIIKDIINLHFTSPLSVCIGNFDGIHLAHRKVLEKTVEIAKKNKNSSAVITFNPHPLKFFSQDIKLLITEQKKYQLIENTGIENLIVISFNENIAKMSPEFFVEEILVKKLNTKYLCVGYNFKFGYRNKGDIALLQLLSKKYQYELYVLDKILIEGILVSSTNIRKLILDGNIELANKLLGYFYCLEGIVTRGQNLGKLLGFPTANISIQNELVPKFGVYASRVKYNGKYYPSVTNIGIKPTIQKNGNIYIETHIINFNQNIYDSFIELELVSYIREEKKFDSLNALIDQMKIDKINAINILNDKKLI
jgi:riboflavin kinase/FMN adenylyltransferase